MSRQGIKLLLIAIMVLVLVSPSTFAAITEQQGEDVAAFAKAFIEEGNARKDENGFPLLTYALSGSWKTCIEIRTKGYNGEMYYVKNNGYYYRNGKYLELGNKWCMDCGTTVLFLLKNTLGLELYNSDGEPWHVQDVYNDARRGQNSQYFDMVYSGVSVGNIDYSKLQKGDIIARIAPGGNHGMLYLGDGYIAHANRDMIRSYGNDKISGFQVNKLNHYFLSGTVVRIMRIKDGIIPEDLVVNGKVTWPDTGETVDLLHREEIIEDNGIIPVYKTLVEYQDEMASRKMEVKVIEKNIDSEKAITSEQLLKTAEDSVNEKMSNNVMLSNLLSCSRELYLGPCIQLEVAKLQNGSLKMIE